MRERSSELGSSPSNWSHLCRISKPENRERNGVMRHLCGKGTRRHAPLKNHFVCCVKIKAHWVIGASFACHREKTYPPFRSLPVKSAREKIRERNSGLFRRKLLNPGCFCLKSCLAPSTTEQRQCAAAPSPHQFRQQPWSMEN